mgnify:CR=1 FL=1
MKTTKTFTAYILTSSNSETCEATLLSEKENEATFLLNGEALKNAKVTLPYNHTNECYERGNIKIWPY